MINEITGEPCEVRPQVEKQYNVNSDGVITSPGAFEGEMYYAVWYWQWYLDGISERLDLDGIYYSVFEVTPEETDAFGLEAPFIYLSQSEQGFISVGQVTREEHEANKARELE